MIDTMWHNALDMLGDPYFWVWVVAILIVGRLLTALEGIHSELRRTRYAHERSLREWERNHRPDLSRTTALGTRVGRDGQVK